MYVCVGQRERRKEEEIKREIRIETEIEKELDKNTDKMFSERNITMLTKYLSINVFIYLSIFISI